MVATSVRELLFVASSVEHHFIKKKYSDQETICTWIAFIYNWTGIVLFVFTAWVSWSTYSLWFGMWLKEIYVIPQFFKAVQVPQSVFRRFLCCFVNSDYFCIICFYTIFHYNYGLAGAWCWIGALEEDHKLTLSGLLAQLFHGHPLIFMSQVASLE